MGELDTNPYTVSYLRDLFKNYYRNNPVTSPIAIETREVGIGEYGKKISSRHLSFRDISGLNKYLVEKTPFFVSYSVGYYKFPDRRPMENKELFGADIVYEFDADDFDLPCKNEHDVWFCKACGEFGNGHKDICPKCQGKTEITEWVCDKCLGHAKNETLRLMDFLETDFNLDPKSFVVSFSGSKGYHLRVTDKSIIPLSKSSRLQMMNYIQGKSLDIEMLGFDLKKMRGPIGENWFQKKFIEKMQQIIYNLTKEWLMKNLGYNVNKSNKIMLQKETIKNKWDIKVYEDTDINKNRPKRIIWAPTGEKNLVDFWQDLFEFVKQDVTTFRIDPMSSSDIYKIMRMPNTIHGGTGFLSNTIKTREDLERFEPLSDSIIFREDKTKKVEITRPINKFRLIDQEFGPYNIGEKIDLPEAVSVYLLLKGVAK
ncbi:MAG TPA: DNA primase small subunit domain-containing protein [archaeon]|nr:DNA primase small subunit domain-containing protein [archaeon]